MDGISKDLLIICGSLLIFFLGLFGSFTYDAHMRAVVISESPDPLYAACAYDSSSGKMPPSCFALITQNKDLPR